MITIRFMTGWNPSNKECEDRVMTNKELIERWKTIASAVFWAENNIIADWRPRLEQANKENSKEVADAYLEAIAKEIIDNSYEEE